MPVVIHVDVESFRVDTGPTGGLQEQLLQEASLNTPLPGTSQPLRLISGGPPPSPLSRLIRPAPASVSNTPGRQDGQP